MQFNHLPPLTEILIVGMLIMLCVIALIVPFVFLAKTKTELFCQLIDEISDMKNPSKQALTNIVHHKRFKYLPRDYQKVIKEKLSSYDYIPNSIEKTMTHGQLYQSNNPLWSIGINIHLMFKCHKLQERIDPQNMKSNTYLDNYISEQLQKKQN